MRAVFRYFLSQDVFINLAWLLCILLGIFAITRLPVERYPNVHMGKVQILTVWPGASPEEVEALVTREIEDALEDLEYVEFIESASYRQRSRVTVKFLDDTDYAALYDELRLKVLSVMNELPAGIDPPTFTEVNVKEWLPVVAVNLVGDRGNRALTLMAEEMKIPLRRIPGVEEVSLEGEQKRELHVFLNPERMALLGITFDQVCEALAAKNRSIPAGDFTDASGEYVVVVDERLRTREEVARTIVRRDADGSFVRVGDVMTDARIGYRDPFVITSVNGQSCVTLKVVKTDEGNALDIVPAVQQVIERYQPALDKEGVGVVLTQDQRITIDDSIKTLGWNLLVGIALVGGIIWLVMGFRNAALTTMGIPFSFLVTMIFMWVTGNSLNEITLFSFVLVSGIIVDDAIVVVENIYRLLQEGRPIRAAVIEGAAEVAAPITASTATTIAAFLPMLIMSGSTGEFFAQVPIAVSFALTASLFECFVFLAPHFVDWPGAAGAVAHARRTSGESEMALMRGLRRLVLALARFCFRFRLLTLLTVLCAFLAAVAILAVSISGRMPLIKIKFFPDEYTQYWVDLKGPVATSIETTDAKLREVSRALLEGGAGKVHAATAQAGLYINEDYEPVFGTNFGHVSVELPVKDAQRFDDYPANDPQRHLDSVRESLAARFATDGWSVGVRAEKGGPPTGKDLNVRAVGPNPENVQRLAAAVLDFLRGRADIAPELVGLGTDIGQPSRVYRLRVDHERAAEFGLSSAQVAYLAGSVLDGRYQGEFRTPDEDVDLKVRVDPAFLARPEDALAVPVREHPSGPVRLGDLTRVETYLEPAFTIRYQNNRAVAVTANLKPEARVSTPYIVGQVEDFYRSVKSDYPGAEVSFAGEFESTQRSYASLTYAFAIAILAIYMILAMQFRSYLQPAIVLSAVIFALTGVVFGKLITQGLFTVNSFIATVGVTGVVVNDSLVLIDFINRAYAEGMSRREACLTGVAVRLRPILLTTLTTVLGLLPMAVGFPEYSLVWGGMASTFVTGLATATVLTLFVVPILWDLTTGLSEWIARRRGTLEP